MSAPQEPVELPPSWARPISTDRAPLTVHGVLSVHSEAVVSCCGLCEELTEHELGDGADVRAVAVLAREQLVEHVTSVHELRHANVRLVAAVNVRELRVDWGREL